MHEAAGFEKLLMDTDSTFHKDPHEAFRLYAPYQSALEDAFAALSQDFPGPPCLPPLSSFRLLLSIPPLLLASPPELSVH